MRSETGASGGRYPLHGLVSCRLHSRVLRTAAYRCAPLSSPPPLLLHHPRPYPSQQGRARRAREEAGQAALCSALLCSALSSFSSSTLPNLALSLASTIPLRPPRSSPPPILPSAVACSPAPWTSIRRCPVLVAHGSNLQSAPLAPLDASSSPQGPC